MANNYYFISDTYIVQKEEKIVLKMFVIKKDSAFSPLNSCFNLFKMVPFAGAEIFIVDVVFTSFTPIILKCPGYLIGAGFFFLVV